MKLVSRLPVLLGLALALMGCPGNGDGGSSDLVDRCEDAEEKLTGASPMGCEFFGLEFDFAFDCDDVETLLADNCEDELFDFFACIDEMTCNEIGNDECGIRQIMAPPDDIADECGF